MSTGTEFDTPESFRGRFEWKLADEKERLKRESAGKVGSLRRFTIRRHRYSRCCKVIFVLLVSMLLTQAFFYSTGSSVSTFDYRRTMPMALFFDTVGYDYQTSDDVGMDHESEDYDGLEGNDEDYDEYGLVDELPEERYEPQENDYEYSDAINQVREEIQNGVREEAIENIQNNVNTQDELLHDFAAPPRDENIMFIPRDAPLPPMAVGPSDKLPSQQKEKELLSMIFPGDHKVELPVNDVGESIALPTEQLRLMGVGEEEKQAPPFQQVFPGMQNLEHDQHDGMISMEQLHIAHAEHELSLNQPQQAAGLVQPSLSTAPKLDDMQLLQLLTNQQHPEDVDHFHAVVQQIQLPEQPPTAIDKQADIQWPAPPPQVPLLSSKDVLSPEIMSALIQQKGNPAVQAELIKQAIEQQHAILQPQPTLQALQQQQQLPSLQSPLQASPTLQALQQQQLSLLQGSPQQQPTLQALQQQPALEEPQQQQQVPQQSPTLQQLVLPPDQPEQLSPAGLLISDHKDPIQQLQSSLVSDHKDLTGTELITDSRDTDFLPEQVPSLSVDLHEEHLTDVEMVGIDVSPTLTTGDLTGLGLKPTPEFIYGYFPSGFMWSVATASFQIEGGWNEDGKGKSIWDVYTHTDGNVDDNSNAHIACDSYHKYLDDIIILKELGVKQYRFSISWTRIQPTGLETEPNHRGIEYYNRLINALLNANIQPVVTLYHWDLPQTLQDMGGWLNGTLIIDAFTAYSKMCYEHFGDRVKFWVTLNEPSMVAWIGYGRGKKAPGVHGESDLVYIAGHNLIRAHAASYRVYQENFQAKQRGFVGLSLNIVWKEPKSADPRDLAATERAMQFDLGWFANPIYGNGDYPEVMKQQIARKSHQQGLLRSRLPEFTPDEIERNKGTSDFFGLNTYTSRLVEHYDQPNRKPTYFKDQDVKYTMDPSWQMGERGRAIYPEGLRRLLSWIAKKYGPRPIYITENGISDNNGTLSDFHRIDYLRKYINAVLKAVTVDGVRVIGYTVWSLMDNFEWERGYQEKLGLFQVDFNDPLRKRTAKASAKFYAQLIANNGFPPPL